MDNEYHKGVAYVKIGESNDGKKTLINNNEVIFIDENGNKIDANTTELDRENKIFLKMKTDYQNILKDTTFKDEFDDAIKTIDNQLDGHYIDIRDGNCGELSFGILRIAFNEYKQKHDLK